MTPLRNTPQDAGDGGAASRRPLGELVVPFGLLLVLASLASAGVALWLFWVTATVLPTRDPGHIPMWRTVAAGFLVYAASSWACVVAGKKSALLRWAVAVASVAAIGLGLFGVADALRRARAGGDFEGYILLMGIILAGHGIIGLLYALLAGQARRIATTAA